MKACCGPLLLHGQSAAFAPQKTPQHQGPGGATQHRTGQDSTAQERTLSLEKVHANRICKAQANPVKMQANLIRKCKETCAVTYRILAQPGSGRACGSIEGSPCHHSTTSCCCTRWHGCKGTTAQAAIDRATKVRRSVLRTGGNRGQLHAATAEPAAAIPCRRLHHPAGFCITQFCLSAMPCCSHPVPVHSQSR